MNIRSKNTRENEVYNEIPENGQQTISTKYVDEDRLKVKACLVVARSFEEKLNKLQTDSPTWSKECLCICFL